MSAQPQTTPTSQPTDSPDAFRTYIESEVLHVVNALVQDDSIGLERIEAITDLCLELIKPEMSLEELHAAAVKLDDEYTELAPVVLKVMKNYESKYQKKSLGAVSELIKNKKYTEAEDVVKKVLAFKGADV